MKNLNYNKNNITEISKKSKIEKPEIIGVNCIACVAEPPVAISALGAAEAAGLLATACGPVAWVAESGASLLL